LPIWTEERAQHFQLSLSVKEWYLSLLLQTFQRKKRKGESQKLEMGERKLPSFKNQLKKDEKE